MSIAPEGEIGRSSRVAAGAWMAFVVLSSLGLSRAFACAMPLAAVAVVAAVTMSRSQGVVLVLLAWFGQQAVGFGLLHYPHTGSTIGWGGAIGLATLAAFAGASAIQRWTGLRGPRAILLAFAIAYPCYEGVLFAATGFLPSGAGAFSLAVVLRILIIDAVALGLLLAVHRLATVGSTAMVRRPGAAPWP